MTKDLIAPCTPSGPHNSNPEVEELFAEYNRTSDVEERSRLVRDIQELIGADVPFIYLAFPEQIVAMASGVSGYTPHPLENYFIDGSLFIED